MVTSPAEAVLKVVAEFGADLTAAAKDAIDAIREADSYAPAAPDLLGLGAVIQATYRQKRFVLVHADPKSHNSQWWSLRSDWVATRDLTDIKVLHPGIDVPA